MAASEPTHRCVIFGCASLWVRVPFKGKVHGWQLVGGQGCSYCTGEIAGVQLEALPQGAR